MKEKEESLCATTTTF